jgi:hypothetical protein
VVGTLVGFVIFMLLLLLAAQVLVRLYATSTLTAVATRTAEQVAQSPDPVSALSGADAAARSELGAFGAEHTTFVWKEVDANQVVLEVRGVSPEFVPVPGAWRVIDRTVTVRTERFRRSPTLPSNKYERCVAGWCRPDARPHVATMASVGALKVCCSACWSSWSAP